MVSNYDRQSMHAKIKAHRDYQTIEQALNGIELLRVIQGERTESQKSERRQ
jgi:hypothetical protein